MSGIRSSFSLFLTVATLLAAAPSFAVGVTRINENALAPLRGSSVKDIRIDSLPLDEEGPSIINLEEFQVWAPGGKVILHGEGGEITIEPPSPLRFYRGLVNDDPQTFAYFSVNRAGHVYGLVDTRERRYAITAQRRQRSMSSPDIRQADEYEDLWEHVITMDGDEQDYGNPPERTWTCALDSFELTEKGLRENGIKAPGEPQSVVLAGTQTYGITVEIQTDYEFYSASGSNSTTAQNYVANLAGAVSTIYNRDLKTNITLGTVHLYTVSAAADPWAATDALAGLRELGDHYHGGNVDTNPSTRTTSAVMMLSGKTIGSGIAWTGVICGDDFFQSNHWGGPYSWNGYILGTGTIPDVNGTNDGVEYGMPSGFQNYWPIAEFAHELGHTLGGRHTHCAAISDAERIASGFTDGSPTDSTSNFVDHCYASEGGGCYSATTNYVPGSQTMFKGTIMSYCHNVFGGTGGQFPQSRMIFGVASEPSQHQYDDYMLRSAGPLLGGSRNIVNGTSVTLLNNVPITMLELSSITAPTSVAASSSGNSASVTSVAGLTYLWSITGGTITGGGSTNSVTFTAGASGNVVLTIDVTNATRCSLRDIVTISIGSAIAPPTNVVATAASSTSVSLTWTAVDGATNYKVLRSADGSVYSQVGNPATNSFTDSTALASTAYLYKVRANNGSSDSGDSNVDLATTVIFTDPTITVQSTTVKAAHVTQLRIAVNAVRTLASLGASSFTDPTITATSTQVKRLHVTELRTALDAARAALSLTAVSYTDPTITVSSTQIKAAHFNELRNGVK